MRIYLYVIFSFFLRLPAFAPIERELEKTLMEKVKGLEAASIKIRSGRLDFLRGKVKRLRVELHGLTVGNNLRVEHLVLEGEDLWVFPWLTFFLNKPRLRDAGEVYWCFTLQQNDLEKFVAGRGPLLRGARIDIDPEFITLYRESGLSAALFDIKQPLMLKGKLEVTPDSNIHLHLHEARALAFSIGRPLLASIHTLINPVVRAADINRMLRRVSVDALAGFGLHSEFKEIKLFNTYADIKGTLLLFKRKPKEEKEEKEENGNGGES